MDPGSEVCMIEKRWLKSLKEGRDFSYVDDLKLIGPGDNEIPNAGTVRIKEHAGLQLSKEMGKIGFDACVVDNPKGDRSWDLLVGNDLPEELGRLILQTEKNVKPLVMIQATDETRGKMKTLSLDD